MCQWYMQPQSSCSIMFLLAGFFLPHNMKIDRVFSDTKMRPFFAWRDAESL